jgi:hypothetical protein
MIKTGVSGGMINLNSFLNKSDRNEIKNSNLRIASTLREAAKDGLQSLYADVDDVLEKYEGTDVVKIMHELRDEKLLWVRARAIDADTVNANGDYFAKAELLKEVDIIQADKEGKKVKTKAPAYKTFEGVPIYANHKNDDVLEAKGMVVHAEWDDDENCVYTVFYVDESAYPDIARGIRVGYMHDVSMGCQVESGECSECGNIAVDTKDYCEHLKKYKGKINPKSGKKVYEKNMGLKFIELSVVGDGAFPTCEIEEIYDKDDILKKAVTLEKKASELHANVMLAASNIPTNVSDRNEYETCLRQASYAVNSAVKIAQTLVGGPLLAGEGAGQNATVSNILKYLGIDPASGLNILDMLNLALNFLEVAIINMFARKDNVDLTHVSKISKSMADLQATMEDLINDGVGSEGQQQAPINQGQPQAPAAAPAAPQTAPQSYSPAGGAGQLMTQNQNFVLPQEMQQAIGGGITASSSSRAIVWSHTGEEVKARVATASSKNKIGLGKALENLAEALGTTAKFQAVNVRAAENSQPIKTNSPIKVSGGNKPMSIWEKFTQQRRLKQAAKATEKFELEDKMGNKIVISSKGDIEAYHNNTRIAWEPSLTDSQIEAIASGNGIEVTAEILSDFSRVVSAAKANGKNVVANWTPVTPDTVLNKQLADQHKGSYDMTMEELLGSNLAERYKREDVAGEETREEELEDIDMPNNADDMVTINELLSSKAGLYGHNFVDDKVKEALLEDARLGNPDKVINEQLLSVQKDHGLDTPTLVVKATVEALGKAVVASKVTPEEIVGLATKLASKKDFVSMLKIANLGSGAREVIASRRSFHNIETSLTPTAAIMNELGKLDANPVDVRDLLITAKSDERVVKTVTASALEMMKESKVAPANVNRKASRTDLLKAAFTSYVDGSDEINREHMKAALMAFAATTEDSLVTPNEVVASISDIESDDLTARIEYARTDSSVGDRLTARARKEFFGASRFAGAIDVADNTIGWLADYAIEFGHSSKAIAEAAVLAVRNPKVAENLVARLVNANTRTAKVQITDEKIITKRINCTVDDLGGLDPKSEDFDDQFRQKAIELLSNSGYTVDPNTFSMNDVSVSPDGYISASVSTRFTKSFVADGSAPMSEMAPEADGIQIPEAAPEEAGAPDVIATASAIALRSAKRKEILQKFAQVLPGMGGPAAAPSAATAPAMGMPAGGDLTAGISSLTTPTAEFAEEADTDELPEPGKKYPVGSICPACGSKDVDLSNGNGHCNSCGTDLEVSYNIVIKPSSDTEVEKSEKPEEPAAPAAPELSPDMGLGAATAPAPAPAAPAAPGAPATPGLGGAVASTLPMMVRISYKQDPSVFIASTQPDFNIETAAQLPVGNICPSCGNRHAKKVQNTRFCYSCGEVYIPRIHKSSSDPSKVTVSIDKVV